MVGEKLARHIKGHQPKENELSDLVFGRVTSTSPLKIQIDNRFEVTSKFLVLSRMVKDLTITISIDGKRGSAQVFRNLQVGDRVRMLRISNGKKYYVLERS